MRQQAPFGGLFYTTKLYYLYNFNGSSKKKNFRGFEGLMVAKTPKIFFFFTIPPFVVQ
jgi:hypothetical protein